jgi:hypothetical protein
VSLTVFTNPDDPRAVLTLQGPVRPPRYGMSQIEDPGGRALAAGASIAAACRFVGMSEGQREAFLRELREAAGEGEGESAVSDQPAAP